jgi:hypothetical protein
MRTHGKTAPLHGPQTTGPYMKYLYKYPQAAFPYADLVETSRSRRRNEFEYELLPTKERTEWLSTPSNSIWRRRWC